MTGSRRWKWREKLEYELTRAISQFNDGDITVVHGGCRSGADRLADSWVRHTFTDGLVKVEVHEADWNKGKRAGPMRNREMVEAGADICLAFLTHDSIGGSMTALMAESAGIPTRRFYER